MNPLILTKISKHTIIGSLSALLAFAGKFNQKLQQCFVYLYIGTLVIFILTLLWEGREQFQQSPEEQLVSLLPAELSNKKRQYLLTPKTRLELVIALVVITVCALVGSL